MFNKIKKCLTAFIAAAVMATTAGCTVGDSTAYVMSINGYKLKAGVFIYYQNSALEEAKNLASEKDENLDVSDEDALLEVELEGKSFIEWVKDKTLANCSEHLVIMKQFDEMELTISEEDEESVEDYAASIYDDAEASKEYKENGIGEESFKEILMNTYKANEIFLAIYGEGGSENVQESALKDEYIKNNVRVKYVALDLHDTDGSLLDDAGKKEIKDMANGYLKEVQSESDEKAMLQSFNDVLADYNTYVSEKTAIANGTSSEETATTTTTATTEEDTSTTTTTVAPYANESIITAVTTDEDTPEDEITYSPSKALYDWAFTPSTKLGVPEIIEDEEKIYVAVKLDIEERMTDDDLWTENAIESQRFSMYSDELQAKIDEWVLGLELTKNMDALERYGPFDYKAEPTEANANNILY